jgi:hypothetical protein
MTITTRKLTLIFLLGTQDLWQGFSIYIVIKSIHCSLNNQSLMDNKIRKIVVVRL